MSTHSAAFGRLIASIDGPISDPGQLRSLDLKALDALRDDELDAATDRLAEALDSGRDDPRLAEALAMLATDGAWAALERALERPCDITAITAAHFLYQSRQTPRALDALEACAAAADPTLRSAAVRTLARVNAPSGDAMVAALEDPESKVRSAALSALFLRYRLDQWDNIIGSRVFDLALGVTSPLPALRRDAVAELREVVARLDAGETPKALGLVAENRGVSEALGALKAGVRDLDATLDGAMVAGLAPHERRYVVEYLSRALARGDARVAPLLAALDTPRARLALAAG